MDGAGEGGGKGSTMRAAHGARESISRRMNCHRQALPPDFLRDEMRCDFDEMRWMDGRMDTYREIPDPKLWLCVGSDTSAVHVSRLVGSRHCLQVAQVAARWERAKKRQSQPIGSTV